VRLAQFREMRFCCVAKRDSVVQLDVWLSAPSKETRLKKPVGHPRGLSGPLYAGRVARRGCKNATLSSATNQVDGQFRIPGSVAPKSRSDNKDRSASLGLVRSHMNDNLLRRDVGGAAACSR